MPGDRRSRQKGHRHGTLLETVQWPIKGQRWYLRHIRPGRFGSYGQDIYSAVTRRENDFIQRLSLYRFLLLVKRPYFGRTSNTYLFPLATMADFSWQGYYLQGAPKNSQRAAIRFLYLLSKILPRQEEHRKAIKKSGKPCRL